MRTITGDQYRYLINKKILVDKYNEKLEKLWEELLELTGEKDKWGFTFDMVFNDLDLEECLRILNIEVEKE